MLAWTAEMRFERIADMAKVWAGEDGGKLVSARAYVNSPVGPQIIGSVWAGRELDFIEIGDIKILIPKLLFSDYYY
jgi:hypothetical protein